MDYEKKLAYQSNYWYNDGLKRAKIRDLTGAVASLRRSLQYNTANVAARNLLGLVYYGRGEVVEALVEWILSKNFQSEDNIANFYIAKTQEVPGELEKINEAVKRYNQCLEMLSDKTVDLAMGQLKKVIVAHPTFIKALQLMALLCIQTNQYAEARKLLRAAHKLDTTDPLTLHYMHEITELKKKRPAKAKDSKEANGKKKREQTVTYNIGNESIIQPATRNIRENTRLHTILNVGTGLLVGVAVMLFLITPAITNYKQKESNQQIVDFSDQIATQEAQISALKTELEEYRANDEGDGTDANAVVTAASTKESYELLIKVYNEYKAGETSDKDLVKDLISIQSDALGDEGTKMMKEITDTVYPRYGENIYSEAQNNYEAGSFKDCISDLETLTSMQFDYDDGNAALLLAECYTSTGDTDSANSTYKKIVSQLKDTDAATKAQEAMNQAKASDTASGSAAASSDAEENGDSAGNEDTSGNSDSDGNGNTSENEVTNENGE